MVVGVRPVHRPTPTPLASATENPLKREGFAPLYRARNPSRRKTVRRS